MARKIIKEIDPMMTFTISLRRFANSIGWQMPKYRCAQTPTVIQTLKVFYIEGFIFTTAIANSLLNYFLSVRNKWKIAHWNYNRMFLLKIMYVFIIYIRYEFWNITFSIYIANEMEIDYSDFTSGLWKLELLCL